MNAHRRPGGLTAMAVVNFVFAGMSALGVLGLVGMLFLTRNASFAGQAAASPQQQAQIDALLQMGQGTFVALMIFSAISAVLLVISGIGYLKLRRFLGRQLGNITAVLSIAASLAMALVMAPQLGGGFNLGTVIGLIYPVLTLFLLNVTFKDDFTNP